ncbi:hypothetical protein OKW49_008487 [Paraburkholderia youngii]
MRGEGSGVREPKQTMKCRRGASFPMTFNRLPQPVGHTISPGKLSRNSHRVPIAHSGEESWSTNFYPNPVVQLTRRFFLADEILYLACDQPQRRACALCRAQHKDHARRKFYDIHVRTPSDTTQRALEYIGGLYGPHEFATLMLNKAAPEQIDLDRAELEALLKRQLVALENVASGVKRPRVTRDGDSLLQAIARKH